MSSNTVSKSILRKKYLQERKNFSQKELDKFSLQIFENFQKKFQLIKGQNIHIFISIKNLNEVNTNAFIQKFFEKKINVFVPKMLDEQIIAVALKPDTELVKNSWGILEPKSNRHIAVAYDYIITPLLYCDSNGNRIGYGNGFYDVFFKTLDQEPKKIGVNFFLPEECIEDVSSHDVRLDYLVTPTEVLSFS